MTKTPATLLPAITEWADEGGIPKDDPFHKIITGLAGQGDRLEKAVKDFGPGAAKLAADAARREVAIGMRGVAKNFSWLGMGVLLATGAALFALGLLLGKSQPVETQLGPMPRQMASIIGMQDWEVQWNACTDKMVRQGEVDWCYMPMVVRIKRD